MAGLLRTTYHGMARLINTTATRYSFNKLIPGMVSRFIGGSNSNIVLDVGCGMGKYSKLFEGNTYVGIDIGDYRFKRNLIPSAYFCRARAEEMPFRKRTFDMIFSAFMIEHVEDSSKALSSIYEVLNPGCALLLSTGTRWARPLGEMHELFWRSDDDSIGQAHHYFDIDELRRLHEEAGFEDVEISLVGGPFATFIEWVITFFRFLFMKIRGQKYRHRRESNEVDRTRAAVEKGLFIRLLGAFWVIVQFPFRWFFYELSYWLDRSLSRLGGARFAVVTARKGSD